MGRRTLLAAFAHPDDESFGVGGTLALYARRGVRVVLVCATRGEAGEIADPSLATRTTLPAVREMELRCAAQTLGVDTLYILGYRDSGMPGAPENNDPRAFIQAPAEEVVAHLVAIIRREKPDVVITFEPNGGYGHPDHIAIHRHTVAAFHAAGDPQRFPELGLPWQPARLFFTAIPREAFEEARRVLASYGVDTRELEAWLNMGPRWSAQEVNAVVDVSSVWDVKWRAIQCHRTQLGPHMPFVAWPEEVRRQLLSREYFALAEPAGGPNLPWNDLFAHWTRV